MSSENIFVRWRTLPLGTIPKRARDDYAFSGEANDAVDRLLRLCCPGRVTKVYDRMTDGYPRRSQIPTGCGVADQITMCLQDTLLPVIGSLGTDLKSIVSTSLDLKKKI